MKPQPRSAPAEQAATLARETPKPGSQAVTKPRTLPNSRAGTPTSPVRETRVPKSDEELFADIAEEFKGQTLYSE